MKITKTFISIFLLTFIIGSASIFLLRNNFSRTEKQNAEKFNIETPNTIKSSQNETPRSEIISYEAAKNFGGAELLRENVSESSLFLSTEAEKNNLVKKVASMITVGC